MENTKLDPHQEKAILDGYFTNTTSNVFALKNLSEVTKGALFARYSRTHKPLRRLFLDEFCEWLPDDMVWGPATSGRASALYEKAFNQFGDDSIAQLGGAHVAIEGISLLAAKRLQRSRLAAYLESSTRYMHFGESVSDYADNGVLGRQLATASTILNDLRHNEVENALDIYRHLLPLGTSTNMGIYASGLTYERMILRHWNDPLPEVRDIIRKVREELLHIIPEFLVRTEPGHPHGEAWKEFYTMRDAAMQKSANPFIEDRELDNDVWDNPLSVAIDAPECTLEAARWIYATMLFPYSNKSSEEILENLETEVFNPSTYFESRTNRRHMPARALESLNFRLEVMSDYATYRDIQRHRMMTIEAQEVGASNGFYVASEEILGSKRLWADNYAALKAAKSDYLDAINDGAEVPEYYLPQAANIRYAIDINYRQLMYLVELRSMPQGHYNYRNLALKIKDAIVASGWSWVLHTKWLLPEGE